MEKDKIGQLAEIIGNSGPMVFFGGAGVSTESGIPDFRSADGIYQEKVRRTVSPEEMVSHSFYERYPEEFFEFYREKLVYPDAEPNDCHKALAALEREGILTAVVTQNIDGLHQKAGSKRVYELHGSVLRNYCEDCGAFYDADFVIKAPGVPRCEKCGGRVKPDVVLYEESLDQRVLEGAVRAIASADTLVIGGTSLVVYPAAGLIRYFGGRHLVVVNKTATGRDSEAELVIREPIGSVFAEVMKRLNIAF